MENKFEKVTFTKRVKSMLKADIRRAFTSPFFYIMIGIAFVIPVLILVMTTMMDGSVSYDQQGNPVVMEGFKNVWQILGSVSGSSSGAMSMDITSMCNINMMFFIVAVLVCVFVADDFRSGYAKNLFTVRAKKSDYVISKTVVGCMGGAAMIVAFVSGALVGGGIAGLPFDFVGFNIYNLICSVISKIALVAIFVSVFVTMSVIGKQKLWLSLLLSLGVSMFLFNIAPMVSSLDSGIINVILCIAGGGLFAVGLGAVSNLILKKTSLV